MSISKSIEDKEKICPSKKVLKTRKKYVPSQKVLKTRKKYVHLKKMRCEILSTAYRRCCTSTNNTKCCVMP